MPTLPAVPAEPDRLPGEPTPELTSVSWETVYGSAVYTEPFKASADQWRVDDRNEVAERDRLIRQIEADQFREQNRTGGWRWDEATKTVVPR